MASLIDDINPNNSATFYHRIGISIADSKIYKLAKSFFTKIGDFFSTCMRFCGEKFNAFKEKVSPPPQQQTNRVPHKLLEEDNGTELREWLSSGGSNDSSAPPSLALVPFVGNSSNASSASQSLALSPENEKKSPKIQLLTILRAHDLPYPALQSLPLVPHNIDVACFPKVASNGSDASSASQSQALVPYDATRAFINKSRNERTDLGRLRQAGAALALRGMGPRAEQFAQFKKYLAQNPIQAFQFPIQAFQFPIQALQFQRAALANRG
jgi:hypothetical protein